MKKILIILLFIASPLQAEEIEKLSWYNLQELLEDDKLTSVSYTHLTLPTNREV